jgi:hypothetical protein
MFLAWAVLALSTVIRGLEAPLTISGKRTTRRGRSARSRSHGSSPDSH